VAAASIVTLAFDATARFVNFLIIHLNSLSKRQRPRLSRFPFYDENDVDVKQVADRAVKDVTDVDLWRKVHLIGMGFG
jgi:hypothetical protein